jgi:hypothetical protein
VTGILLHKKFLKEKMTFDCLGPVSVLTITDNDEMKMLSCYSAVRQMFIATYSQFITMTEVKSNLKSTNCLYKNILFNSRPYNPGHAAYIWANMVL